MRLNYAVGFLTLIFVSMVSRLILCGLFVSISFGDGDYAGGKLNAAVFVFGRSGQVEYRPEYFAAV